MKQLTNDCELIMSKCESKLNELNSKVEQTLNANRFEVSLIEKNRNRQRGSPISYFIMSILTIYRFSKRPTISDFSRLP